MKKWIYAAEQWCNRHEWVIFLLLLGLLLRAPSLFTPHYYGDEEIYFVMGRAWSEGVPLYEQMFDHKPPLIYILAGIFPSIFLFRTMLLAVMSIHTVVFWQLAKQVFAKYNRVLPYLASVLFVGLTSLPTLEGNIVNAELLMMLPVTIAILIIWSAKPSNWRRWGAAGVVAGIGWLFKIPVAFDVAAIGLYFWVISKKTWREGYRGLWSPGLWAYVGGFILPLAASFGYYYLKGHGESYLATVLTMNLSYVSSWQTASWQFNPLKSGLVTRGMILIAISGGVYLLRNRVSRPVLFSSWWLAWSWFGALLSGRPYPHYLQEPVVPLALWLPSLFAVEKLAEWGVIGAVMVWGVVSIKQIGFWWYPSWPLYRNLIGFVMGQMDKEEYLSSFDGAKRNYRIARYLKERMGPEEKLYVWGSDAAIYNITKKLPAGGKYIVNFHVHDLQKHEYVMENLRKNTPIYIVVLPGTTAFPQLDELLEREYIETLEVEGAKVYRRMSQVLGRQDQIQ